MASASGNRRTTSARPVACMANAPPGVRFSIRSKLGARGLRTIMEEAMHDLMFTAPEREPGSIKIDGEYIRKSLEQCDDTLWREED